MNAIELAQEVERLRLIWVDVHLGRNKEIAESDAWRNYRVLKQKVSGDTK